MAKTKKLDLFEMTGIFDKDADCWRIDCELTPDGLKVLEHFIVKSGIGRYVTGKVAGETEGRQSDVVATRYLCRKSFFGMDMIRMSPEEYLYLFDKDTTDAESHTRSRWAATFQQVRQHGEGLHDLFQKMTLESCIANKKYIVKCHAELEGE